MYLLTSSFDNFIDALQKKSERKVAFAMIFQFIHEFNVGNKELEDFLRQIAHKAHKIANDRWVWNRSSKLEAVRSEFSREIEAYQ